MPLAPHPRWLLAWVLLIACLALPASAAPPALQTLASAEAVAGDWQQQAPPQTGWTPVALPDDWSRRWRGHDGVVWYRLHWDQATPGPVGLLVPYVCLASTIYVNGAQIQRDPQLVEPLSRGWTQPRYFVLDAPLLRQGRNDVLVRVAGLAAYQPGMGVVKTGDPALLQAEYRHDMLLRHDVQLVSRCVGAVLGVLFGMLWLLGRRRAMYGWFALSSLFSALYGWNFVATSPWPFTSSNLWSALNIAVFFCGSACLVMFLLRYSERRWPRTERLLLAVSALSLLLAVFAPDYLGPGRMPWALAGTAIYYLAMLEFIIHALRGRQRDQQLLALCFAIQMAVSLHDLALFLGWLDDQVYLLSLTSPLTLLGIGFALAYRYAQLLRRVEGFNAELHAEVERATAQLAGTLAREHALALDNTRINERLNLVRDLHDGFGGTLLGTIAALEQPDAAREPAQLAAVLRDMRDDLRLVVDSTSHAPDGDLLALLAPLRHRWSTRLDAVGIDAHWRLEALAGLHPPPAACLDVTRLLQEALTNVLKHSQARRVEIHAEADGVRVRVRVQDDGRGLAATSGPAGMGLGNMRARAFRLGGSLEIGAAPGNGTRIEFSLPA